MLNVAPCETLKFLECNNNEVGIHVTCCCTVPIIYKIQTTAPEKFRVRPRCGVLEPKQTVHICIVLKPDCQLNEYPKDKFLILGAIAPLECDLSTPQRVTEVWKKKYSNVNCNGVEQHRLTCIYGTKEQLSNPCEQAEEMLPQQPQQQIQQIQQIQSQPQPQALMQPQIIPQIVYQYQPEIMTTQQSQQQQQQQQQEYQIQYPYQMPNTPQQSQQIAQTQTPRSTFQQSEALMQNQPQYYPSAQATSQRGTLISELQSAAAQSMRSSYQSSGLVSGQTQRLSFQSQSTAPNNSQRSSFESDVTGASEVTRQSIQSANSDADMDMEGSFNPMDMLTSHANQMEKQLRLTQAVQYVTIFVLMIVSVAVCFLLRTEVRAAHAPPISPMTINGPPSSSNYFRTKLSSSFNINPFKKGDCMAS